MKRTFYTKNGETKRDLSPTEIKKWADMGDEECRKYLAKKELVAVVGDSQKIDVIAKVLGLK